MLESIPVTLAVGSLLGFLSGLGVGGGSLLILWLTLVLDMELAAARQINLLFFLPSAFVSCLFRRKQGRLCLQRVLPAVIAGCACAILGNWLGSILNLAILRKGFGLLLLATGIRELCYKPKKRTASD